MTRARPPRELRGLPVAAAPRESTFQRIRRTGKLRLGGFLGEEPYFGRQAGGRWEGVCVALAQALATALEAEIEIVEAPVAGIAAEVASGKFDLAFVREPDGSRTGGVEATEPIFYDCCAVLPHAGFEAAQWVDLDIPQTRIAVDIGSADEALARRLAGSATITGFKTREEAIAAVLSGRSDCAVSPALAALLTHKHNPQLGAMSLPAPYARLPVGGLIAAEQDRGLYDAIASWRNENRGNGKIRDWVLIGLARFGIAADELPPDLQL